ncbi:AMIN-like domain-containing (lipo)protein [Thermostaphylospora chromogena]|uniref:AMIN-like domain-containing protein n=1 Tax=Thermostaphylospora chromogena TaxID=35622 RepID=A0A1H1ED98_9ACTN|nr:hypothetical protein [Thermostaphylospora chromogena]SDQ86530.1 hypothetical protein SAMN04489764_2419 [Thermostaphylospora chromogena]
MNGRVRIALTLVCLVTLTACGGAGTAMGPSDTPAPGATTSKSPSAESPPTADAPTPDASTPTAGQGLTAPTSTRPVEVTKDVADPPIVTGVRYGGHRGFDRVVIDLDGGVPGYAVRWVDQVVQDGSGEPIDVEGGAFLQITLRPAHAHTSEGEPTWTGGPVFHAGLPNVRDVVRNGDFEAVVSVAIALDHRAGFRVLEQRNPSRLVVDVAH